MRLAVLVFCLVLPLASYASPSLSEFVSYECSTPFPLRNFKTHLARGNPAAAIDWNQIPEYDLGLNERLLFELSHPSDSDPEVHLFTWQHKEGEDFSQYRTILGSNLTENHPISLFPLHDLNMTLWPNFGSVLAYDSRLIVAGQGAIIVDQKQSRMSICKLTTLHVRGQFDTTMPGVPGFHPNFRALEPWLRELLASDGFKQAMPCSRHL